MPKIIKPENHDFQFKIQIIGDPKVGKSALLVRAADSIYDETAIAIDNSFTRNTIYYQVNGKKCQLIICDTHKLKNESDFDNFQLNPSLNYKLLNSHAVIICFDMTNYQSFQKVDEHVRKCQNEHPDIPLILVGTKSDLQIQCQVGESIANNYAAQRQMDYIKTSAMDGTNIEAMLDTVVKQCLNKILITENQNSQANESCIEIIEILEDKSLNQVDSPGKFSTIDDIILAVKKHRNDLPRESNAAFKNAVDKKNALTRLLTELKETKEVIDKYDAPTSMSNIVSKWRQTKVRDQKGYETTNGAIIDKPRIRKLAKFFDKNSNKPTNTSQLITEISQTRLTN